MFVEMGEVQCVPRKGDLVDIYLGDPGVPTRYRVVSVLWSVYPMEDCLPAYEKAVRPQQHATVLVKKEALDKR